MLKITRTANGEVVIKLSGRMDAEDLTLVDRDAVSFLKRCEADNITLRNCPAYIREWITREGKKREM